MTDSVRITSYRSLSNDRTLVGEQQAAVQINQAIRSMLGCAQKGSLNHRAEGGDTQWVLRLQLEIHPPPESADRCAVVICPEVCVAWCRNRDLGAVGVPTDFDRVAAALARAGRGGQPIFAGR